MQVTNQKPVTLSPVYKDVISQDFDPIALIKSTITTPLFTSKIASKPVSIKSQRVTHTDDTIAEQVINCCGPTVNVVSEQFMKELLSKTLANYDKNTNIGANELFVIQSGTAENLPEPNDVVIYTPSQDVIPSARRFLDGRCTYDMFFASLAYYARPVTLGFYFANEIAFNEFKDWLSTQMITLGSILPPETNKLVADFQKLTLNNLTESLLLRNDDGDNIEPNSFARLIVQMLMTYTTLVSSGEFGVLPFNVGELICPKTVVFVNVELHARASSNAVAKEWKLINDSLHTKPKVISNTKLNKLTAQQRNLQKISSIAARTAAAHQNNLAKAANMRFSKTRPTTANISRLIKKVMDKMSFVNKSMNTFRSVKTSFAKPNRRNPDDFNKQGKLINTKYKPDIHLYIDTSGSISERDYEDAVKACIHMAKKLNIGVYFNSFSHYMSQTTKLDLKDKSTAEIYKRFQKVPKVTGGTNYAQIWHFINKSVKRTREISLIITDFEYYAPSEFIKHPQNLYYIPCSTMNWNTITRNAESFAKTVLHNDPNIRKHLLF